MHPEPPLTRLDVVTNVIFAALTYNVLGALLNLLYELALVHIPALEVLAPSRSLSYCSINLIVKLVLSLAYLTFTSLMADSIVGRTSAHSATRLSFIHLICRCVGLLLFLISSPAFVLGIYDYLQLAPLGHWDPAARLFLLQNVALPCIKLSLYLILAFRPTLFVSPQTRNKQTVT